MITHISFYPHLNSHSKAHFFQSVNKPLFLWEGFEVLQAGEAPPSPYSFPAGGFPGKPT